MVPRWDRLPDPYSDFRDKDTTTKLELPLAPIMKNISDLKTKANNEIDSSYLKISSLQVVSTHMWRSIIRHSGLSQEVETQCKVAYLTPAKCTVEKLLDHSLGWATLQISNLVKRQTNENCKTFAEDWVRNVKSPKSSVGSRRMACSTIVVSSSPRFEVYNNDFGWGKPIAARAGPGNDINGKLVIFPGVDKGSIDIQTTLWSEVLVNHLADVEFLENVTTA